MLVIGGFFAFIVGISSTRSLIENKGYQYFKNIVNIINSVLIYGLFGYYFRKATLVFKKAAEDFNMEWNQQAFILH